MNGTPLLYLLRQERAFYRVWKPTNSNIVGVVHILHGMAEHGERYNRFANYLNSIGYVVYAQDHRGHGLSATDDDLGWFSKNMVGRGLFRIQLKLAK